MPAAPTTPAEIRPLGTLLDAAVRWLEIRGVADARQPCELLAARLLRLPRLQLPLERSRRLLPGQVAALRRGILRLGAHEPVQYILGEWDFRGLTFKVDRRALPEPALEAVKAATLNALRKRPAAFPVVLATSSRKGTGMPELRAAIAQVLGERS